MREVHFQDILRREIVNPLRALRTSAVRCAKISGVVAGLASVPITGQLWEHTAIRGRHDVGAFGASVTTSFTTSDPWGIHLNKVGVTITEPGAYTIQVSRGEQNLASQSCTVTNGEPGFINLDRVTGVGGVAGYLRRESPGAGWANYPGQFVLTIIQEQGTGNAPNIRTVEL